MKKLAEIALLGAMLAGAGCPGLQAQQGAVPAAEQPAARNAQPLVRLQEGAEVQLALAQKVTGRAAVVGEPVELVLAEDLRAGDVLVVRKGARVLGTIIEGKATEKKRGQPKHLRIRVDFIKAGDTRIMLRGEQEAAGKRNKKAMVAGSVALGVSGLLLTMGKKYEIPVGTPVTAYVDQDVDLAPLE